MNQVSTLKFKVEGLGGGVDGRGLSSVESSGFLGCEFCKVGAGHVVSRLLEHR